LLGYGFFVSFLSNYVFKSSVLLSNGAYFLMSLWLIINCVVSSPPVVEVNNIKEGLNILFGKRNLYSNSYNLHRKQLDEIEYRTKLLNGVKFLKIPLQIT
jgi:hypothetical protein